jgi:hypothetical protein
MVFGRRIAAAVAGIFHSTDQRFAHAILANAELLPNRLSRLENLARMTARQWERGEVGINAA